MNKVIIAIQLLLALNLNAQVLNTVAVPTSSIRWTNGLSLEDVKNKAKAEQKYIFLDAFTTWCGPCKMMDKETFTDPSVIKIISEKFIPVKVQMDKTKNDDEEIRKRYADASALEKQFRISSYPTYIFLSPNAEVVHIVKGYREAKKFIKEIENALIPGKRYVDVNEKYFQLKDEFVQGVRNYAAMPYLFKNGIKIDGEIEFAKEISKIYRNHLESLPSRALYTKENIEFLSAHALKASSPFYKMFYPKGKKVDKAMKIKGFAQSVVDQIIQRDIVEAYLKINTGGMRMMGGKTSEEEANWDSLYSKIESIYGDKYSKRNVIDAKLKWYRLKFNNNKYWATMNEALQTLGFDSINAKGPRSFMEVYGCAGDIFKKSDNTKLLNTAIKWMQKIIQSPAAQKDDYYSAYHDTYADLLSKIGKWDEAIEAEKKAIAIAASRGHDAFAKMFERNLAALKKNKPASPINNN